MNALPEEAWLSLAVGCLLILAGRRLVWLAVAAAGFVLGAWAATVLAPRVDDAQWIVALVTGAVGALLALALQRLAIAVAGAGLGALMAVRWAETLARVLGIENQQLGVLVAIAIGALVGLLLASKLFALAAALVTAAIGSVLVATQLPLTPGWQLAIAGVLLLVGLSVQLGSSKRSEEPTRQKKT